MRGRSEGQGAGMAASRDATDARMQPDYGSTTQFDTSRPASWEEMEMGSMSAASIAHEHRASFLLLLLMLGMLAFSVLTAGSTAHGIQKPIQKKGRVDTGDERTKNEQGEQQEQPFSTTNTGMRPKGRWTHFLPLPSPGTTITIPPGINISSGTTYEITKPPDEGGEEILKSYRQWNFRDGLNISMWEMGRGLHRSCLSCVHSECDMANELVNKTESSPPCIYFCESEYMVKSSRNGLALSMAMGADSNDDDTNSCAQKGGLYMAGSIQSRWAFQEGQVSIEMRMEDGGPRNAETCLRILGSKGHTEINMCVLPMWGYDQATLYTREKTGRKTLKFVPLNFKASKAFHTYSIKLAEDSVQWMVDGNALHSENIVSVQNAMRVKISYQPDAIHPRYS